MDDCLLDKYFALSCNIISFISSSSSRVNKKKMKTPKSYVKTSFESFKEN